MLMIREGESLEPGQIVQVYRNLNKPGLYSIRDKRTGVVVAYAETVLLKGKIKFHVSKASRLRVIANQRRNVHAWVEGVYEGSETDISPLVKGYYNPYKYESFIDYESKQILSTAEIAVCHDKYVYYN